MPKLIIDIRSDLPATTVLDRVSQVVAQGRISDNGKHYCYATTWPDGVAVYARRNLASDTFTVVQEEAKANHVPS